METLGSGPHPQAHPHPPANPESHSTAFPTTDIHAVSKSFLLCGRPSPSLPLPPLHLRLPRLDLKIVCPFLKSASRVFFWTALAWIFFFFLSWMVLFSCFSAQFPHVINICISLSLLTLFFQHNTFIDYLGISHNTPQSHSLPVLPGLFSTLVIPPTTNQHN